MKTVLPRRPLSSLFLSIACQVLAFGIDAIIVHAVILAPWMMLAAHAVSAFLISVFLRLSVPWRLFNLLLVPTVGVSMTVALPSTLWAVLALLFLVIFLPTLWTRVPYYPTPVRMYEQIAEVLPTDQPFSFMDLGCGFSGLLAYLARERPNGHFYGMEIGPLPFLCSRLRAAFCPNANLTIIFRSFWSETLAPYDTVYAFLAPPPMADLWDKVRQEMKPGSLFITNTFPVGEAADFTRELLDGRRFTLYFHRR